MATSLPFVSTNLIDAEVPGAVLEAPIEAHSVDKLKRWLQCHGQKVNGKKADLVERVKICISQNTPISKTIDGGRRYNEKLIKSRGKILANITNKPDKFPIIGWKKFPSHNIPVSFSYGAIYSHFIVTAVVMPETSKTINEDSGDDITDIDFGTAKPLKKGRQFFASGHIKNMEDCLSIKNKNYCIKCRVMSSYREAVSFNVMVMLDKTSGLVLDSACECAASAMGRCSHIAGLLFAVEDYTILFGYDSTACTSKTCEWNKGREKKEPTMITDRQYSNKKKANDKLNFSPCTIVSSDKHKLSNNLLYECQLYAAPTMWELLLDYTYDDYSLSSESHHRLRTLREVLVKNLYSDFNTIVQEVPNTQCQNSNPVWHCMRRMLITASNCKDYFTANPENMFAIINRSMWFPTCFSNKYVNHGKENETKALADYINKTGNAVKLTGLWMNSSFPGLGASPDGLVFDNVTRTDGLIEIKCPYVLKDCIPTDLSKLSPQQRSAFCSTLENDCLTLKKTHKYYYQIQMQLGILNLPWCDFVIWTFHGIHHERIMFDEIFWNSVAKKLLHLHSCIIAPEYFEMRIPRKLKPFYLTT